VRLDGKAASKRVWDKKQRTSNSLHAFALDGDIAMSEAPPLKVVRPTPAAVVGHARDAPMRRQAAVVVSGARVATTARVRLVTRADGWNGRPSNAFTHHW